VDRDSINQELITRRYGEIDVLRATAIILMIFFHLVYDLREFAGVNIDYQSPFWFVIGKASALLFIFLSGLSSGFTRTPVRRGLKVLFFGIVITFVTYLFLKEEYVRFGILHFLGVAMLLSPLLLRLSSWILGILAALSVILGFWFKEQVLDIPFLLPFGLKYAGFTTIDYYPLFPYLAVTILGVLVYRYCYARQKAPPFSFRLKSKPIRWLSRNSLAIYLVHQLIFLFFILMFIRLRLLS
jgi:uncharacterized membrane protein